jgi:hypothetical protein
VRALQLDPVQWSSLRARVTGYRPSVEGPCGQRPGAPIPGPIGGPSGAPLRGPLQTQWEPWWWAEAKVVYFFSGEQTKTESRLFRKIFPGIFCNREVKDR